VTGSLGASAAGLLCLQKKIEHIDPGMKDSLLKAHLTPTPRVKEASILVKSGIVGAVNDISDGLASELHEIALASGCGAHIWAERIPIDKPTAYLAQQLKTDPLHWALYGGEDYELVITISGGKGSPLKARRLARSIMKATGTPLHFIGRIFPASEGLKIVYSGDRVEPLLPRGYNHFCPHLPTQGLC
jgi:thiamine-monophosphate kinase